MMPSFVEKLRDQRRKEKLAREYSHMPQEPFYNPVGEAIGQWAAGVKGRVSHPLQTLASEANRWRGMTPETMTDEVAGMLNPVGGLAGVVRGGRIADLLNARHPNVDAYISEGDNLLTLNKVVVPKEVRGKGYGSKFLSDLVDAADAEHKTIALTPSPDFGGNKAKLVKWYKNYGFLPNKGRNIDFSISETMIRKPK